MLVLSRQRDETIVIGDDIEMTIVDIRGDKVRIGIRAPSHVAVHRKEVYDAIKRENEQAARFEDNELNTLSRNVRSPQASKHSIPASRLTARPSTRRESA
jgi:carbon storage regulator